MRGPCSEAEAVLRAIPLGLLRLPAPPNGERTLLLRRGDGERRGGRPLDGERWWRRPRGDGERERRGLRPRLDPVVGVVEAPDREHREPELLFSLGRLEEIMLERPQPGRYIMQRQRRHKKAPEASRPSLVRPFFPSLT